MLNLDSGINLIADPLLDGVDHINIYSKGETAIGRCLSHFYESTFVIDGTKFHSVEGYWYWLSTGCQHPQLKLMSGYSAKKIGRQFEKVPMDESEFKKKIILANYHKIDQNKHIKKALIESELPFMHYYVKAGGVEILPQYDWLVEGFEVIRVHYKRLLKRFGEW